MNSVLNWNTSVKEENQIVVPVVKTLKQNQEDCKASLLSHHQLTVHRECAHILSLGYNQLPSFP